MFVNRIQPSERHIHVRREVISYSFGQVTVQSFQGGSVVFRGIFLPDQGGNTKPGNLGCLLD